MAFTAFELIWILNKVGGGDPEFEGATHNPLGVLLLQDGINVNLARLQFQETPSDSVQFTDSFQLRIDGVDIGLIVPVEDLILLDASFVLSESFSENEISDNLLLTDTTQTFATGQQSFNDSLALSDVVVVLVSSNLFSDQLILADQVQIQKTGNFSVQATDVLNFADSTSVVMNEALTDYLRRYLNDVQ